MRSPLASPFRGGWRNLTPMRGRGRGGANPWTPAMLPPYAWYDAELGQPKNVGYVELSGVSGDYISTPGSAALSFSNDIEVVMRVRPDDWTAAANQTLAGKYVTTGSQRTWRFYVSTAGAIGLTASANGTAVTSVTVTPTVAMTDAAWVWLRMRLDLTDGANSVATLETAADTGDNVEPLSWTANGTNTGTTIAGLFDSTAPLEIGAFASGTSERLSGRVGRCIVRSGFAGTVVADFNADDCYGPGYAHADGYYWTLGIPKIYDRSGNNVAPAVFGSGTNQPLWLPWTGSSMLNLPGVAGNQLAIGYTQGTATSIASWDAAVKVSLDQIGVNQFLAGSGSTHFTFKLDTSNRLQISLLEAGFAVQIGGALSTSIPELVARLPIWLRGKVTVASALCEYWISFDETDDPEAVQWVPVSSGVGSNAGATPSLIETGTSLYGAHSSGVAGAAGRYYAGRQIQNDGTIDRITSWQANQLTQTGGTPAVGGTMTVSRSTTGRKTVVQSHVANSARSVISLGTDDWIVVPASAVPSLAPSASAAVGLAIRQHATPTLNGVYYSNKVTTDAPTGKGVVFNAAGATLAIGASVGDGTNGAAVDSPTYTAGTRVLCCMDIATRTSSLLRVNGATPAAMTAIASVGDATNATDGFIGRRGSSVAGYQDFEFEAFLTRSAELGDVGHGRLVAYYGGGL